MMMFVIFLIVNVGTIGIFYGVYGTKRKYEEGMQMHSHKHPFLILAGFGG